MIDLRSDTVTKPTDKMREAMKNAVVGDDVYGDDPTVNELEKKAAEAVGKEAALFVPSGTFGNQLALLTHCKRGEEVILGDDCHIVAHECGASAVIAGVQLRTIQSEKGRLPLSEVKSRIRFDEDIHYPKTGLICLENAHSNGRVIPLESMSEIYGLANENGIPVHLDGARLFNAAAALGVSAAKIVGYADSVMFCLSKGLCAPVGSILAGKKEFIDKARRGRKLMGGGLRQVGVLAAPGLIALQEMSKRLEDDHENARFLGDELSKISGIKVLKDDIHINMVYFDLRGTGYPSGKLTDALYSRGILINGDDNGLFRFVTHYWITRDDISLVVNTIKSLLAV